MFRWLRERRNPALKCERLGHIPADEIRQGYKPPTWYGVADYVEETRKACSRCSVALGEWKRTDWGNVASLRMPDECWRVLRKDGVFWMRGGHRTSTRVAL